MRIAMALALMIGVVGPGLAEYVNRPLQTEHDIRQSTGLAILTVIPRVDSRRHGPELRQRGGRLARPA